MPTKPTAPARDAAVNAWLDAERAKYQGAPDPDQAADLRALAVSQAAAHTTTALDALLAVSPLALEGAEREALAAARRHASTLHRALEARRAARVVEGRGPVGPARWGTAETGDNEGRDMKGVKRWPSSVTDSTK